MGHVLVIGASGGIGSALVRAFSATQAQVTGLSCRHDGFDITDTQSVARHLGELGPFDTIVVATGALEIDGAGPEKTIRRLDPSVMAAQFQLNAIGPALVLSHAHRLLPRDRPSVLAVLSARVGSIEDNRLGGWISYRSAKAAVNQIVRTSAIELARSHPKARVAAVHPGTVATRFSEDYLARHSAVPADDAARNIVAVLDGLHTGPSGRFVDYAGQDIPW